MTTCKSTNYRDHQYNPGLIPIFAALHCLLILGYSQSISYYGPLGYEATDYFEQELLNLNMSTLRELQCINTIESKYSYSSASSFYYENSKSDTPVNYFKLTLTSEMKEFYTSSLAISTCCDFDICNYDNETWQNQCNDAYQEYIFTTKSGTDYTDSYCGTNNTISLDTYVYILQSKKGQINVVGEQDDSSCTNSEKSYIDLSNYDEGEYIIAVGPYGVEVGVYFIHLECVKYLWPIQEDQIDPPSNTSDITCGDMVKDKVDTFDPVHYYTLDISEITYFPITINFSEDITKYIIKAKESVNNAYDYEILASSADDFVFIFDDEELYPHGEYYVVIQELALQSGDYQFTVSCGPAPTESPTVEPTVDPTAFPTYLPTTDPTTLPTKSPTIEPTGLPTSSPSKSPTNEPTLNPSTFPSESPTNAPTPPPAYDSKVMIGLATGSMSLFLICLGFYYVYEWYTYCQQKSGDSSHKSSDTETKTNTEHSIELAATDTLRKGLSIEPDPEYNDDDEEDIDVEAQQKPKMVKRKSPRKPNSEGAMMIKGVSVRRLDKDLSITEQIDENEDVVQAVLAHSIDCCNENEEFDIYQVLAVRYYHERSRKVTATKPFAKFGYDFEVIKLSPFVQSLFMAFIIGLTQTWGSSVVVYKLWNAYFDDGFNSVECDMTEERWSNVFSLKVLAFLLSLVVTFFISILLKSVKHNGLYEIMETLELKHVERIENVSIFFIQFGQFVNYYVCMTAILGSYFIIFISNQGEKEDDGSIDYSSAGLDMILNAVALFFLMELDNMMVTDEDYEVCSEHLQEVLENYTPDVRINEDYKDKHDGNEDDNDDEEIERTQSVAQMAANKFVACGMPFVYYFVSVYAMLVTVFCYFGGFFAPFVIFFCW